MPRSALPLCRWDPFTDFFAFKYSNPSLNETNKSKSNLHSNPAVCTVGKLFATAFYHVELCLWIGDVTLTLSNPCNYLANMTTLLNFSVDRPDCASFIPPSLLEHKFKNYNCSSWRAFVILIVDQNPKTTCMNTINIKLYYHSVYYLLYTHKQWWSHLLYRTQLNSSLGSHAHAQPITTIHSYC